MPNDAGAAVPCDVKDLALAEVGKRRAEWAFQAMPVLQTIRKRFIKTQPLAGVRGMGAGRPAGARHKTLESVWEFVLRDGHPASVMDLSFANQALSVEFMTKNHATLDKRAYGVPEELDRQVARMKLESMGVKIGRLTLDRERYLTSWPEGT
jgi:S-adenosylhomocysteine hydrolase